MPEIKGYRIRESKLSDTESLGRVHSQVWQETYPGLMPAEFLSRRGSVEARTEMRRLIFASTTPLSCHLLVENDEERVVGFGDCGPAKETGQFAPAEINTLYLLQEAQGKGLGKKLLFKMLTHLASKNFGAAALKTNAGSANSNAFYRHCGGQIAGQIKDETWLDTVYIWPDLKIFTKQRT